MLHVLQGPKYRCVAPSAFGAAKLSFYFIFYSERQHWFYPLVGKFWAFERLNFPTNGVPPSQNGTPDLSQNILRA